MESEVTLRTRTEDLLREIGAQVGLDVTSYITTFTEQLYACVSDLLEDTEWHNFNSARFTHPVPTKILAKLKKKLAAYPGRQDRTLSEVGDPGDTITSHGSLDDTTYTTSISSGSFNTRGPSMCSLGQSNGSIADSLGASHDVGDCSIEAPRRGGARPSIITSPYSAASPPPIPLKRKIIPNLSTASSINTSLPFSSPRALDPSVSSCNSRRPSIVSGNVRRSSLGSEGRGNPDGPPQRTPLGKTAQARGEVGMRGNGIGARKESCDSDEARAQRVRRESCESAEAKLVGFRSESDGEPPNIKKKNFGGSFDSNDEFVKKLPRSGSSDNNEGGPELNRKQTGFRSDSNERESGRGRKGSFRSGSFDSVDEEAKGEQKKISRSGSCDSIDENRELARDSAGSNDDEGTGRNARPTRRHVEYRPVTGGLAVRGESRPGGFGRIVQHVPDGAFVEARSQAPALLRMLENPESYPATPIRHFHVKQEPSRSAPRSHGRRRSGSKPDKRFYAFPSYLSDDEDRIPRLGSPEFCPLRPLSPIDGFRCLPQNIAPVVSALSPTSPGASAVITASAVLTPRVSPCAVASRASVSPVCLSPVAASSQPPCSPVFTPALSPPLTCRSSSHSSPKISPAPAPNTSPTKALPSLTLTSSLPTSPQSVASSATLPPTTCPTPPRSPTPPASIRVQTSVSIEAVEPVLSPPGGPAVENSPPILENQCQAPTPGMASPVIPFCPPSAPPIMLSPPLTPMLAPTTPDSSPRLPPKSPALTSPPSSPDFLSRQRDDTVRMSPPHSPSFMTANSARYFAERSYSHAGRGGGERGRGGPRPRMPMRGSGGRGNGRNLNLLEWKGTTRPPLWVPFRVPQPKISEQKDKVPKYPLSTSVWPHVSTTSVSTTSEIDTLEDDLVDPMSSMCSLDSEEDYARGHYKQPGSPFAAPLDAWRENFRQKRVESSPQRREMSRSSVSSEGSSLSTGSLTSIGYRNRSLSSLDSWQMNFERSRHLIPESLDKDAAAARGSPDQYATVHQVQVPKGLTSRSPMPSCTVVIYYSQDSQLPDGTAQQMILCYAPARGPGSLHWYPPGSTLNGSQCIALSDIVDVYVGKRTEVMALPVASKAVPKRCFSIVSKDGTSVNFETGAASLRAAWVYGIHRVLTSFGQRTASLDDEQVSTAIGPSPISISSTSSTSSILASPSNPSCSPSLHSSPENPAAPPFECFVQVSLSPSDPIAPASPVSVQPPSAVGTSPISSPSVLSPLSSPAFSSISPNVPEPAPLAPKPQRLVQAEAITRVKIPAVMSGQYLGRPKSPLSLSMEKCPATPSNTSPRATSANGSSPRSQFHPPTTPLMTPSVHISRGRPAAHVRIERARPRVAEKPKSPGEAPVAV